MEHQGSQEAENANSRNQEEGHNDTNQLPNEDANILGNIIPLVAWQLVGKKLPSSGKRDMSNASPYFRDLLLRGRATFLLPDVLKPLSEHFEKEELERLQILVRGQQGDQEEVEQVPNILQLRQICKSWNESVDQFIEDSSQPAFFNTQLRSPKKSTLAKAKYTYFGNHSWKGGDLMAEFELTHSPLLPRPPRNPFIGRLVVLHIPFLPRLSNRTRVTMMDQGKAMLQQYGQHIRILNIGLSCMVDDHRQNHLWLNECLALVPNLTHLKVCTFPDGEDMQFGEHIENPVFASVVHRHFQVDRVTRQLDALLEQAGIRDVANFEEVQDVNVVASPLPYLKCLKLCHLPAVTFNNLIQTYRNVEWLHIEHGDMPGIFFRRRIYFDWRELEFPNLNKFYIQLRSPAEARQLWHLDSSLWGNVTSVHVDYSWRAEFFEWSKILETIEEHWGKTLVELKLRLPKPSTDLEKAQAFRDAVNCRLNLPKLKRLKVWICRSCVDFPTTVFSPILRLPGLKFMWYHDNRDH